MPRLSRNPSHAGSWYENRTQTLDDQISAWMDAANISSLTHPRAIIAPHAGYAYCGHVMPYAYKHINPALVSRVFLLGPSHHAYTRKCTLSPTTEYDTPLGSMVIDQQVYAALRATGKFETMSQDVDEAEHSLELHTPFIKKVMGSQPFLLVPIMVGSLTPDSEREYGSLLAPYLDDPTNLFVISSDFCHWGRRFQYTFHNKEQGPIWKSIEWLDRTGMTAIESGDPAAFTAYLQDTSNTICGRHPIGVLLNMVKHATTAFQILFQHYAQSSQCQNMSDSSVSYAAATVTALA